MLGPALLGELSSGWALVLKYQILGWTCILHTWALEAKDQFNN